MSFLKKLTEQREEKVAALEGVLEKAKTEERAASPEELAEFDKLEKEIASIDETMKVAERARGSRSFQPAGRQETTEEVEERAFTAFIMENRAGEKNMTMGDNGAIVPTTIANRIIKRIKDICPILAGATIYNVKGTLKVPVWGDSDGHDITVAFQEEFTELTADTGKFTSVDLSGYLAGALTLIGRSLENNGTFNVVDFIVNQMAEEIAVFLENKLLNGQAGKTEGALATRTIVTAASAVAITADELIRVQAKVKQAFQTGASWTMHPDTFLAIKMLKDNNGRYLLQDDVTGEFPYRLLGKPVYLSDNMETIATGKKPILYGDYKGLAVNMRENISIEVLREKFATQHAIGVVAWMEFDSKVTDHQKLAVLQMA